MKYIEYYIYSKIELKYNLYKTDSNEFAVVESLGATYFMKKDFIKDKLVELVKNIFFE